ncbi:hypothetical protein N9C66_01405 [Akkermansiaceae bacterium]|nr:hypothetical protein [Akkermansiaceae bacterium]MDA9829972.1 hypothetical protein [Akkermansiaceae bacterium]
MLCISLVLLRMNCRFTQFATGEASTISGCGNKSQGSVGDIQLRGETIWDIGGQIAGEQEWPGSPVSNASTPGIGH